MFVVVKNEEDMETLRALPMKFKRVFNEVLHQVDKRCDDIICVQRIERGQVEVTIYCRMLAKSGYNGTKRVCEIINEIFQYNPHEPEIMVADMFGNDFLVRICNNTHDLNKNYKKGAL